MATATDVRVKSRKADNEIDKIFRQLIKHNGSDLHMQVGKPPILRVRGTLRELQMEPITKERMWELFDPMISERDQADYQDTGGCDFSYVVVSDGEPWRFRVNMLMQMGNPGMVSRKVERSIPNFEGLYLPPIMEELCKFDQGMVLLAGVTGSGKSTTIASMLNWVNHNMRKHILTIEDPIEFVYTPDKCLINQREVGIDVKDFKIAMKHAVREDPDIMLVGEMRDMETFETALHAAETGHLVFGTIHASMHPARSAVFLTSSRTTCTRLCGSMAFNMRAIVAQKLIKTICEDGKGPGRVPIVEIMTFNPTVKKLILEEQDEKLPTAMRIGKEEGMQRFNESLYAFLQKDMISRSAAFEISPNVEELKMMIKGIDVKSAAIL